MHLHFLGISGTFMGSLALIAKQAGHHVTGCDTNTYPPMSEHLEKENIHIMDGYKTDQIKLDPDLFIIGNVVKRGNPLMEAILNLKKPYTSGPQWLAQTILSKKTVLSIAGTHGKTTTASMVAWILECANLNPSFLIGGIPKNFGLSGRLTSSPFFVIEADEYDTAFFDKRAKFTHYLSRFVILNNLEFDHADIYPDLAAIERQFYHLVRTIPADGAIVFPIHNQPLTRVLKQGHWSELIPLGKENGWQINLAERHSNVFHQGKKVAELTLNCLGDHNAKNALAAIALTQKAGIDPKVACEALSQFSGVKRRLELVEHINGIHLYDDFAHHPTAISASIKALKKENASSKFPKRVIVALELRSNTMKQGDLKQQLSQSLEKADLVFFYTKNIDWDIQNIFSYLDSNRIQFSDHLLEIAESIKIIAKPGDVVVVMSNGNFGNLKEYLKQSLKNKNHS